MKNKALSNRIKRVESKAGTGSALKSYIAAISNTNGILPPFSSLISPEKQTEIDAEFDKAFAGLNEEELALLADL